MVRKRRPTYLGGHSIFDWRTFGSGPQVTHTKAEQRRFEEHERYREKELRDKRLHLLGLHDFIDSLHPSVRKKLMALPMRARLEEAQHLRLFGRFSVRYRGKR